jgi:hypothetical protein
MRTGALLAKAGQRRATLIGINLGSRGDDLTGAGSEQQRMDPVSALERLSIPTQRLQDAIQRMSRRQSGATPSADHRFRL